MRKQILSVTVIITLVLTACAQSKKATNTLKSANINYLSMERSTCFGQCPNYIIEMYESGLVRYTGRMFAEPQGTYEKTFDKAAIEKIFREFSNYRVDTCSPEYFLVVADLPGLTYNFKYDNNKSQEIQNAHFGPGYLKTMGKTIDALVKKPDESWKKTAEYKERD